MKVAVVLLAIAVMNSMSIAPVQECTQSLHLFVDNVFDIIKEIESHLDNPSLEVFLNLRKTLQGAVNICFNQNFDFSQADLCITKLHPIWNMVDNLIIAIKKNDTTAILTLSTQIALTATNAIVACSHK